MSRSYSRGRTLLTVSRIVAPCLIAVGVAATVSAEPVSLMRTPRRQPHLCDPRTAPLRKVIGAQRAVGPVANRQKRTHGLTDTTARLSRASRAKLGGDAVAIQNDAPAAQIEFGDGATSPLRALGVLLNSFDRLPPATPFSPRSPRGPPSAA
jgi:hypothetical protein